MAIVIYKPFTKFSIGRTSATYNDHLSGGRYGGHDWAVPQGTPLLASLGGKVIISNKSIHQWWGYYVVILHEESGLEIWYCHLMKPAYVQVGQTVVIGTHIGDSGSTGNSTGPHLHFAVKKAGLDISSGWLDPMKYLHPSISAGEYVEVPTVVYVTIDQLNKFKNWGIDISHHQQNSGIIAEAKKLGASFVIAKCSEGNTYKDNKFVSHWNATKSAGMFFGAYHYVRPEHDAQDQAMNIVSAVKDVTLQLPIFLDVETSGNLTPKQMQAGIKNLVLYLSQPTISVSIPYDLTYYAWKQDIYNKNWSNYIDHLNLAYPGIYTSAFKWNSMVAPLPEWDYLFSWIADWRNLGNPAVPTNWKHWMIHQVGQVRIAGYDIDANVWNPTQPFPTFTVEPPTPPPPPPPPPPQGLPEITGSFIVTPDQKVETYIGVGERVWKAVGEFEEIFPQ